MENKETLEQLAGNLGIWVYPHNRTLGCCGCSLLEKDSANGRKIHPNDIAPTGAAVMHLNKDDNLYKYLSMNTKDFSLQELGVSQDGNTVTLLVIKNIAKWKTDYKFEYEPTVSGGEE